MHIVHGEEREQILTIRKVGYFLSFWQVLSGLLAMVEDSSSSFEPLSIVLIKLAKQQQIFSINLTIILSDKRFKNQTVRILQFGKRSIRVTMTDRMHIFVHSILERTAVHRK